MDNSEKWALAGLLVVLLVVGVFVVHVVQDQQRQDRIEQIGRDMGDRLAQDMLD